MEEGNGSQGRDTGLRIPCRCEGPSNTGGLVTRCVGAEGQGEIHEDLQASGLGNCVVGWWCHSQRQDTQRHHCPCLISLFLSVATWLHSDEDLQPPSGEQRIPVDSFSKLCRLPPSKPNSPAPTHCQGASRAHPKVPPADTEAHSCCTHS